MTRAQILAAVAAGTLTAAMAALYVLDNPDATPGIHPDLAEADCWIEVPAALDCATAISTPFLCRYGLLYGPGLGGVDADGNPVTCDKDTPRNPGVQWCPYRCSEPKGAPAGWTERHRTRSNRPDPGEP